jgi:hypothetical protein
LAAIGRNIALAFWFNFRFKNVSLVDAHFRYWSSPSHVNRRAFQVTMDKLGGYPANVIETGSSAWGTNSTRFWDSYIRSFGGSLVTVDIRPDASKRLLGQLSKNSKCIVSDSVSYLTGLDATETDLYFLDSWDVDWANPEGAANHGLAEFKAIRHSLKPGALVLIDDTPASLDYIGIEFHDFSRSYLRTYGVLPGKGALVLKMVQNSDDYEILLHEYALLFRKNH